MTKDFKGIARDLITMQLTKKFSYSMMYNIFKIIIRIMTGSIISEHINLEILCSYKNI